VEPSQKQLEEIVEYAEFCCFVYACVHNWEKGHHAKIICHRVRQLARYGKSITRDAATYEWWRRWVQKEVR